MPENRPDVKSCAVRSADATICRDERPTGAAERASAPPSGRGGVPTLRRSLRQGRLSGCVHRARLSLRLLVRSLGPHVHGVHAEGLRGRDRPRFADGG
jgi:hypothetical protein